MTKQEAIEFYRKICRCNDHIAIDWSQDSEDKTNFINRQKEEIKTDNTVYFISNASLDDLREYLVGGES